MLEPIQFSAIAFVLHAALPLLENEESNTMKKIFGKGDKDGTQQAQPAASKSTKTPNPIPHDENSDKGKGATAKRQEEIRKDDAGQDSGPGTANDGEEHPEVKPRSHTDAVEAQREPVAAPRSQDADPEANKGVTVTTEGGTPVAHPGSTLR